jgi:hypothetical protein
MSSTLQSIRLAFEPLRTVTATSIAGASGSYIPIGDETEFPSRQILVQNLTDVTLVFSLDGINDHFALPTSGFLLLDVTSNAAISMGFFIASGTTVYVNEIGTPTTGSVYVSSMYGAD